MSKKPIKTSNAIKPLFNSHSPLCPLCATACLRPPSPEMKQRELGGTGCLPHHREGCFNRSPLLASTEISGGIRGEKSRNLWYYSCRGLGGEKLMGFHPGASGGRMEN